MADQNNTAPANGNGATKKEMAKAKLHTVVGRLFHDGKFFKRGSKISLTPEQAKPLGAAVKAAGDEEESK